MQSFFVTFPPLPPAEARSRVVMYRAPDRRSRVSSTRGSGNSSSFVSLFIFYSLRRIRLLHLSSDEFIHMPPQCKRHHTGRLPNGWVSRCVDVFSKLHLLSPAQRGPVQKYRQLTTQSSSCSKSSILISSCSTNCLLRSWALLGPRAHTNPVASASVVLSRPGS